MTSSPRPPVNPSHDSRRFSLSDCRRYRSHPNSQSEFNLRRHLSTQSWCYPSSGSLYCRRGHHSHHPYPTPSSMGRRPKARLYCRSRLAIPPRQGNLPSFRALCHKFGFIQCPGSKYIRRSLHADPDGIYRLVDLSGGWTTIPTTKETPHTQGEGLEIFHRGSRKPTGPGYNNSYSQAEMGTTSARQ